MAAVSETLNAIYDILVEVCSASDRDHDRDMFLVSELLDPEHSPWEYRFGGKMGSGGKVYATHDRWYVDCYAEDYTPSRRAMIEIANKRLAVLRASCVS